MTVVIVGAGLAGLTCARILQDKNIPVVVLEKSDGVGGRVRTDIENGFYLDRGFQVLFTAYPAVRRRLDLNQLDLRFFDPGAIIAKDNHRSVLSDPLRDPPALAPSLLNTDVSFADKLRTLNLALRLKSQTRCQTIAGPDSTTLDYLQREKFSARYIDNFIRPFYGGIFLDRSLNTSAKVFRFTFKMLSEGQTAVPATGMGRISQALAAPLVRGKLVRLNTGVAELCRDENGRVTGVRLENGETMEADMVVVATPAPEAARLTGLPAPEAYVSTVCLYYSGKAAVYASKKLILNASSNAFVNNAVQLTNVAPEYAPSGQHLLSATVVGQPEGDDEQLLQRGLEDLHNIFAGDQLATETLKGYKPLAVKRVPYAQFAQPSGIHPDLPENITPIPGLVFAAEFTEASSINAAMVSGEKAAKLIVQQHSQLVATKN